MTRKDFQLIADALRASKPADAPTSGVDHGHAARQTWRDTANKVADVLQATHVRFDRIRFALASGIDGKVG